MENIFKRISISCFDFYYSEITGDKKIDMTYSKIVTILETLKNSGVISNYSPQYVDKTKIQTSESEDFSLTRYDDVLKQFKTDNYLILFTLTYNKDSSTRYSTDTIIGYMTLKTKLYGFMIRKDVIDSYDDEKLFELTNTSIEYNSSTTLYDLSTPDFNLKITPGTVETQTSVSNLEQWKKNYGIADIKHDNIQTNWLYPIDCSERSLNIDICPLAAFKLTTN